MSRNDELNSRAEMYEDALAKGREEGRELGREIGLAEGREVGLAEGRAEGRAEGKEIGLIEGRAEGRSEASAEIIRKLITSGMSAESIASALNMSIEEIEAILS